MNEVQRVDPEFGRSIVGRLEAANQPIIRSERQQDIVKLACYDVLHSSRLGHAYV